jgi:hypothetical protein
MKVKEISFLLLNKFLISILASHYKSDDNRQLSGRKRTPIDLDNTEGVFSQQGDNLSIFCFSCYSFC